MINLGLWTAAFALGFGLAYGVDSNAAFVAGKDVSSAGAVVYDSFSRLLWSVCLCWVVFACEKGYGGVINSFLTWEAFAPLSRMSYCMFLIHMTVMQFLMAQITYHVHFGHFMGVSQTERYFSVNNNKYYLLIYN